MNLLSDQQCYWSPFAGYCNEAENAPYCCLKRSKSESMLIPTAAQVGHAVAEYYNFREYQGYINIWHNHCHTLLAANDDAHMVELGD